MLVCLKCWLVSGVFNAASGSILEPILWVGSGRKLDAIMSYLFGVLPNPVVLDAGWSTIPGIPGVIKAVVY